MFYSFLQQPSNNTWIVVRSGREPQEIAAALQKVSAGIGSSAAI